MSAWEGLADRIEKRIRKLPANNPGYISPVPETLGRVLSGRLIRKIAEEAAIEAALTNLESTTEAMPIR